MLSDNADTRIFSKDTKKDYIENANAFNTTDNKDLQGFLQYVKTGKITTDYTGRIEQMIQTVKQNELARREYHILPAALMDAFDEGEARGKSQGSRQKALETAKTMLTMHYPFEIFVRFQDFLRRKYGRLVICNAVIGIRQGNCEKVAAF